MRIFAARNDVVFMNGMNIKIEYPRFGAIMCGIRSSDLSLFEFLISGVLLWRLHLFPLFLEVVTEFLHADDQLLVHPLVLLLLPDKPGSASCLARLVDLRCQLALVLLDLVVAECEHLLQLLLLFEGAADHAAGGVVLVQGLRQLSPGLLQVLTQLVHLQHQCVPLTLEHLKDTRHIVRHQRLREGRFLN